MPAGENVRRIKMTFKEKVMNYTKESQKIRSEANKEKKPSDYYRKRGDGYFEYLVSIVFDVQWMIKTIQNDSMTDEAKIRELKHTIERQMEEDQ